MLDVRKRKGLKPQPNQITGMSQMPCLLVLLQPLTVIVEFACQGCNVVVLTLLQLLRCRVRGQAVKWSCLLLGRKALEVAKSALVNQLYTTASAAAVVPTDQTFAVLAFLLCKDEWFFV